MAKKTILALVLLLPVFLYGMDREDMRDRIRLAIGETDSSVSYYSNTELNTYINDGIRYVSSYGIGVAKQNKIPLTEETHKYDLPSDYLNWISVLLQTSDSIKLLDFTKQDIVCSRFTGNWDDVVYPEEFTILGDSSIMVCPWPANTIDTILFEYVASATVFSSDTIESDLKFAYEDMVIKWVVAQTYWKDGKLDLFSAMMDYVDSRLTAYSRKTFDRRTTPEQKQVVEQ